MTGCGPGAGAAERAATGPAVIDGKTDVVIEGIHIASTRGDCLRITGARRVTVRNVEIGPCAGNGIAITGSQDVTITDSYIHPGTPSPGCCDRTDGIFAVDTAGLVVRGNVVAFGETNIEIHGGSDVTIRGNFLLNPRGAHPRGQQVQCWSVAGNGAGKGCRNITIANNYLLSSGDTRTYRLAEATQDAINLGFTIGATVSGNHVSGGHSASGCGILLDKGAGAVKVTGNRLVDTGQCGIGVADGTGNEVTGNLVLNRKPVPGAGNSGIYVWQFYGAGGRCANTRVADNTVLAAKPDGSLSGYWKGPGCGAVALSGNRFGAEASAPLAQARDRLRPPSIPPEPAACVARAPWSSNRSLPACKP